VLDFGRHVGWSLGEIARVDPGYLQWLASHRDGGRYRAEIVELLAGLRPAPSDSPTAPPRKRRGLFG
jgi:Exodeoxyribonuclease X-like C-terminal